MVVIGRLIVAGAIAAAVTAASAEARAQACDASRLPPDPPGVKTHARVEKTAHGYRATLDIETSTSRGERVLEADSCEALARSAAVVVAMAVAPEKAHDDEPPPPAPAPAPPPAPAAALAPEPDRAAPPAPAATESRANVSARVDAVADSAVLPSFAVGGGLAVGVDPVARLHLELHAALFAEQQAHLDADRGAGFSLASGGARGCFALTRGIELSPCAGLQILRLSASGFGAQKVSTGDAIFLAPEGALALRVPLTGTIALRAGAGAIVPLARESFVITARGTVHEVPAIALRGFLGPEVRF